MMLGVAVGIALAQSQRVTLSNSGIEIKRFAGKAEKFLFDQGTITFDEVSGMKAWMHSGSPNSYQVTFTPKDGSPSKSIVLQISKKDSLDLIKNFQETTTSQA